MAGYEVDHSEVGMPYEVQGVVSRAKGEPVSPESVTATDFPVPIDLDGVEQAFGRILRSVVTG
ncbi:hypothetical protein [Amycolatopsis keratiniphila]|uniref:Uncharacterized protein n=1 Tax=Amycolatopsis keratiniphila subsp. keratiniphila TaxID=227715 RepID=A0A1W2LUU6_9PSEU|nr:hypothetical protein [Amycolatopsis keratiniphila]ONF69748.1 hypothetical protein AVR91_0217770 [Amycolatopsis keratiniphila subsp. keratiniphila]